jgi:hypothetical protein
MGSLSSFPTSYRDLNIEPVIEITTEHGERLQPQLQDFSTCENGKDTGEQ